MNCTDATEESATKAAVGVFLLLVTPAVSLLGIAANLLNIVVLTRKWMSSSTNCYLTGLAVTDIVYLAVYYIITLKLFSGAERSLWFMRSLTILFPLANLFSNYATWLTCLFTFERWLVIHRPMLGRKFCTRRRAKHLMVGVFVATLVFTFPNFLEYRVRDTPAGGNCTGAYGLAFTSTYRQLRMLGYYHLFPTIFIFGPLLFLIVFNSLLIHSVVKAKKQQQQLVAGQRQEQKSSLIGCSRPRRHNSEQHKITLMLIAVVILFCLCQLPSAFVTLRKAMQRGRGSRSDVERVVNAAVNTLLQLNAACNFILYSCFSTRFRSTCTKVFLDCRRRRPTRPDTATAAAQLQMDAIGR